MTLTPAETIAADALIALALAEDLGGTVDVTSQATIPEASRGRAAVIVRSPGVVAGLPVAELVCRAVDPKLTWTTHARDGEHVPAGTAIAEVAGPMRSLLTAERTLLNFLQRLSGIATLTRRYVEAAGKTAAQVLDTRKTTPGWRLLEKYAVRAGGGQNHRIGLYDGILIKDNHLAALGGGVSAVSKAIEAARHNFPRLPVEVEVDRLDQFDAALASQPEIILLDNMPAEIMRECVARRNRVAPKVQLEASGGVNLSTIAAIAATGVDRISVGALTHSATALDIALDYRD